MHTSKSHTARKTKEKLIMAKLREIITLGFFFNNTSLTTTMTGSELSMLSYFVPLFQANLGDLADLEVQEDLGDQQQSDQDLRADLGDLEVLVAQVDLVVLVVQEAQVVQQRNLESLQKPQLNPQEHLVVLAVQGALVDQGVQEDQEALGVQEVQEVQMVLQRLLQENPEDLADPGDQEDQVVQAVLEARKRLHLVNQEAPEDRVVLEAQGALEDRVDLEVQDVSCAQERKQRQKAAQQSLEVQSQQPESLVSLYHQVT